MNHEAAYQSLAAVCAPLDIGILGEFSVTFLHLFHQFTRPVYFVVNNVGRSHEMPTDFVDTTQKEIDDILAINIHATLRMTSMVLPGMIHRYTSAAHIALTAVSNIHAGNADSS